MLNIPSAFATHYQSRDHDIRLYKVLKVFQTFVAPWSLRKGR